MAIKKIGQQVSFPPPFYSCFFIRDPVSATLISSCICRYQNLCVMNGLSHSLSLYIFQTTFPPGLSLSPPVICPGLFNQGCKYKKKDKNYKNASRASTLPAVAVAVVHPGEPVGQRGGAVGPLQHRQRVGQQRVCVHQLLRGLVPLFQPARAHLGRGGGQNSRWGELYIKCLEYEIHVLMGTPKPLKSVFLRPVFSSVDYPSLVGSTKCNAKLYLYPQNFNIEYILLHLWRWRET